MQNPEKIEIEGLKTIHKLCKFGADHNMEGCSFTEIVERMFDKLAKAQAVPEGFVLVRKEPSEQLLSKAIRKYLQVSDLSIITSRMAHLYELMIQEAMIEAQEPAND